MSSTSSRRKLVIALLISTALNLFFIGAIAFRAYMMNGVNTPMARPLPPSMNWLISDLDPGRRRELQEKMQSHAMQGRTARTGMLQAQRRSNQLMASEILDRPALEDSLTQLRSATDAYQRLAHQQMVNLLAELSAEERATAMRFLQRRGPRGAPNEPRHPPPR